MDGIPSGAADPLAAGAFVYSVHGRIADDMDAVHIGTDPKAPDAGAARTGHPDGRYGAPGGAPPAQCSVGRSPWMRPAGPARCSVPCGLAGGWS